jgi:alkylation response protein AidB-like acyl-CoA dehydrogenase
MKVDLEGAKFAVYQTVWKVDQGIPATFDISATKAWVNQACQRICAGGHQVHGGIGVMDEYDMQLYSRRETAEECFLGDTYWHREIVAQHLDL